jgi:hypothetical protein
MAWVKSTQNGRVVATETLTFTQDQTTDLASSEIDFIPKGADFQVQGTVSACLSAAADIAVYTAPKSGGTYVLIKDNLIATGVWDVGSVAVQALYDNSANGDGPYFKIYIDPAGAQDGDSVYLTIIA